MSAWSLIPAFFNALGSGISEAEKSRRAGEAQNMSNRQPGMKYQQAPDIDRSNFEAATPAKTMMNLTDLVSGGMGTMTGFNQAGAQLFAGAIQGEKDMYNPHITSQGAYAASSPMVDSSKRPYASWRF